MRHRGHCPQNHSAHEGAEIQRLDSRPNRLCPEKGGRVRCHASVGTEKPDFELHINSYVFACRCSGVSLIETNAVVTPRGKAVDVLVHVDLAAVEALAAGVDAVPRLHEVLLEGRQRVGFVCEKRGSAPPK